MKVRVKRAISTGGRHYEPGAEANLPADLVRSFGADYVEVIGPDTSGGEPKQSGTPADKQAGTPADK